MQGDANRSYSDDDRSSCNFEENDKQKDSLHLSGNNEPLADIVKIDFFFFFPPLVIRRFQNENRSVGHLTSHYLSLYLFIF